MGKRRGRSEEGDRRAASHSFISPLEPGLCLNDKDQASSRESTSIGQARLRQDKPPSVLVHAGRVPLFYPFRSASPLATIPYFLPSRHRLFCMMADATANKVQLGGTSLLLLPSSSLPPLTPPITPDVPTATLPSTPSCTDSELAAIMATALPGSSAPLPDANPFEQHILSLLSTFAQQPSPSYPFPDQPTITLFDGPKSQAQESIELAVASLGQRLWAAERAPAATSSPFRDPQQVLPNQNSILTPAWTPPVTDENGQSTPMCPTCTRPVEPSFQPLVTSATFPTISSHPLATSLSTPPAQLSAIRPLSSTNLNPTPHSIITTSNGASVLTGGPGAASWSVRGAVGESGMTAEKELELLKAQVQDIARVCKAVATGDLTQKIIVPVEGQAMTELKDIINSMVDRLKTFAVEVERVSLEVGTQGKLGGQAVVEGVEGTWRELTAVVNKLAANLTNQVRSIAKVTKAVAKGDLSETIDVEASGEIAELKTTVNGMVRLAPSQLRTEATPTEQVMSLRTLADEVSRVSLEVGSQGKLGGQAYVPDVEGVWKDLTVNVSPRRSFCWL